MGQRAQFFEEKYTGPLFQGSYMEGSVLTLIKKQSRLVDKTVIREYFCNKY